MDRSQRKKRVRAKVKGTEKRPRLSIFRSLKYVYGQAINDDQGHTLAQAQGTDASKVGEDLARKLLKLKVEKIVFDRGGYKYGGRVKKIAEALREKGLEF